MHIFLYFGLEANHIAMHCGGSSLSKIFGDVKFTFRFAGFVEVPNLSSFSIAAKRKSHGWRS